MLERASVLSAVLKNRCRDGPDGQRRLRVGEARGWRLVQIAAFPGTLAALEAATRPVLGVDLPVAVGRAAVTVARRLMRIGAGEFWIVTGEHEDIATQLQSAVTPAVGSVTLLSHSRTCLWIDGAGSREVLASGIAVDLHPEVFGQDCFALTALHHTPIVVYRSGENRFELFVMRTFALWTWEWLLDAALPFGYEVSR